MNLTQQQTKEICDVLHGAIDEADRLYENNHILEACIKLFDASTKTMNMMMKTDPSLKFEDITPDNMPKEIFELQCVCQENSQKWATRHPEVEHDFFEHVRRVTKKHGFDEKDIFSSEALDKHGPVGSKP